MREGERSVSTDQLLSLLLAISVALNIAGVAGVITHRVTPSVARACAAGGAAWVAMMGLYFAALAAYGH
jgi:hypothetical protein